MSTLASRLEHIRHELNDIDLICVTKYASLETIRALISLGERTFGESKVQDTTRKIEELGTPDVSWHLIGHLQSNKVNQAIQIYDCIQSIDRLPLLEKIQNSCERIEKIQSVYLQVNMAQDDRHGFSEKEIHTSREQIFSFKNIKVVGIMTIAPHTVDDAVLSVFYRRTRRFFEEIQALEPSVQTLSMGMSQDYKIAIQEKSTMVRLGSILIEN